MDLQQKAAIRKQAKARFIRTVIVLCILSAAFFVLRWAQTSTDELAQAASLDLRGTAVRLNNEFIRFYVDRSRRLIACPPSARSGDLETWATRVQKELGQPAAVYLRTGSKLVWAARSDELVDGVTLAEASFHADSVSGNRDHPDRDGTMLVSHWSVPAGAPKPEWQVWMVGREGDSLRWGVVVRQRDVWPAFSKRLSRPRGDWAMPADFSDPAWLLKNDIALPASEAAQFLTKIRAFDGDGRLLFASPGLDTTALRYRNDLNDGRVVEYFQSSLKALADAEQARDRLPWIIVVFPLILIVPIYRSYRQVRQLTEPEPPVAANSEPVNP